MKPWISLSKIYKSNQVHNNCKRKKVKNKRFKNTKKFKKQ